MALVCSLPSAIASDFPNPVFDPVAAVSQVESSVVLAGGCFWCTEAVYRQLDGVKDVVSGYSGGTAETANYEAVCTNTTGHAEVIKIDFDPHRISLGQLLKVFFSVAHDPTTLNRQGDDVGTQYRSSVFFADEQQREVAEAYIAQLNAAGVFTSPIVTLLEPLQACYPAENYHQNYAAINPERAYIQAAALPKVAKVRAAYPEKLKS